MSRPQSDPREQLHLATIAHEGKIWDAYLVFDHDPSRPHSFRASIRFVQAGGEGEPVSAQTAVIVIEESYEAAVDKTRAFDDRALQAMLRSALPD